MLSVAQAQGRADGVVLFGGLSADELSTGYLFGDFMLQLQEGDWGAELGMFGVVGRMHETYASASWQRGQHKIELGFPRPAYDRYAVSGLTQIMPRLALESISTTRSRATSGVFTETEFLPYGAVYSGRDISLSLHGVPDTDLAIAGLGGRKIFADWQFDFGVEAVSQSDTIDWNVKAQAIRTMAHWRFGVGIYAADANDASHVAELFAEFPGSGNLSLTALLRQTQGSELQAGGKLTYAYDYGLLSDIAVVGGVDDELSLAVSVGYQF
jgi:hypothetical protein